MKFINLKEYRLDEHSKKQKKMDLLNSKISVILPELMSRNLKLGERLKNKLKVSTLFNNIEHRNKKYLKGFIFSSNKRAKDLKTGLEMNKALKQSTKKIILLSDQMKKDLILRNKDILLNEKKLLSENTEQETHLKINDFIHTIKNALKPQTSSKTQITKKLIKSMTEDDIIKAKNIIDFKILKEENDIKEKIDKYINKMRNSFDNKNYELNKAKAKRDFNRYVDNMYLENNIKLINYSKPKPVQIKDKESANLVRIKKFLYPSKFDLYINKTSKTFAKNSNNFALRKNSSMDNIYNSIKNKIIKENQKTEEKLKRIDVNGKDTMEVLNNLVEQGEFLPERLEQKLKKVNSLIEINLPFPVNYELVLEYIKNHPELKIDNDNEPKKMEIFLPKSEISNLNKINITPFMRNKLLSIKESILENKNNEIEKINKINIINENKMKLLPHINYQIQNSINYYKNNNDKSITNRSSDYINYSTNSVENNKSEIVFITSKK